VSPARRNRVVSFGAAGAVVAAARALVPDDASRAALLYGVVISLGYGHLLGGAWAARDRWRARLRRGAARTAALAFVGLSLATLFALHLELLARAPSAAVLPLLAISAWHGAENDAALARAYRSGLRLGSMPRGLRHHARALAGTAAIAALFAASRGADAFAPDLRGSPLEGALPLHFADVFALFGLQHLLSWLVLLAERGRALARAGQGAAARRLAARLAALHLAGAAPCLAALLVPAGSAPALRAWLLSPAIYLFWSTLHVAQTAASRGIDRRKC
jgi:hypothetical protein